jgi:hypothetical protein
MVEGAGIRPGSPNYLTGAVGHWGAVGSKERSVEDGKSYMVTKA